jgi:hypothetical protein
MKYNYLASFHKNERALYEDSALGYFDNCGYGK